MRVRSVVKWLGLGFVVTLCPVLIEIEVGRGRANAETGREADEEVAAARALVGVLEAKLRSTESNLKKAKDLLAQIQNEGRAAPQAAETKDATSDQDQTKLVEGVWRIAGIGGNQGKEFSTPPYDEYKIMTAGHYLWLSFDPRTGQVVRSGGGTYTLKNGNYTARVECSNSDDLRAIIGQEYQGTCRVEGKKWYHYGSMPNGAGFDELWERVN
jgi:hypothetical protein